MNNKNGFTELTKKYNIPQKIKNYKIEKELFTISNSHFFIATNLNIKEKVLIKIYNKEIFQHCCDEIFLINNEIFILKIINHKHCLKLYEIIESPSYIFLILEYTTSIKLIDFINRKKKLTEEESLNIYKQIISILIYFHQINIAHLNINPENILIDPNNNIKICDFKYSLFYSNNEKINLESLGDENYLCPEIWYDKSCFPEFADIWSSGVLLYLLIVGQLPFQGKNNYNLQKKIMGAEFSLPLNISKNMQELFKNIFEPKIDERYNLEKILNSNLFKEKKINKTNLPKGFNIFTTKYPIDERIIEICKTNFDIEPKLIKEKLSKNIFDSQTSLYKQIISKFIHKKVSTEMDLTSTKFNTYITNTNNSFDDNTKNINIEENLKSFSQIKKFFQEQKIKIGKNQNMVLNKLNEFIKRNKNIIEESKEKQKENIIKKNESEKFEIKEIKKEIVAKNKDNVNNDILDKFKKKNKNININNKKRGTIYHLSLSSKPKKINVFENKINMNINDGNKRRLSNAISTNYKFHFSLEKNSLKNVNKFENKNNKAKKYISNKNLIIKETKEEEKMNSKETSNNSSRSSSISKKNEYKKENKNIDKKEIKINSLPSKSERVQKEKRKTIITKNQQNSKEDFFNQIKGIKLKKIIKPNTYINSDEIKKKTKEENKNTIDYNINISVKGVGQIIEDNLKNSKKNINLFTKQGKNITIKHKQHIEPKIPNLIENKNQSEKEFSLKEIEKPIITPEQARYFFKHRKSLNYYDIYMFKSRGIIINAEEFDNLKSKDDSNTLKFSSNKKDIKSEEELKEITIPKSCKSYRKKKEEGNKMKKSEGIIKKETKEKENMMKKDEEIIKKEEGEKENILKEELYKERIEKEKEEKKLKELEELRLKQENENEKKIKKELEEWELQRNEIENEEKIKKELEELKEWELQENEIEKEEERIRQEKEKIRLEEVERCQKENEERKKKEAEEILRKDEEKKSQKETEERIKKEVEEKIRIEEEEEKRIKKIKDEKEKKKREIQEENRKLLEEYEKKRKEEDEKKLIKEKIKKKKEEEIRLKREMEFKAINEKILSQNKKNCFETKNFLTQNSNKFSLKSNPFDLYKRENTDEDISPKKQYKENKKSNDILINQKNNRKAGPKFYEFNQFRKQEEIKEQENKLFKEEKNLHDNKTKNNNNNLQTENKDTNKNIFDKYTDFFFSDNKINNMTNKKKECKNIKINEKKENQKNQNIFYRYQLNHDTNNVGQKINNRSLQTLNNNLKDKTIYQEIQRSFNNITNEDYLNQNNNTLKIFKRLKIGKDKEHKRNNNSYSNNIHSIKLKKNNTKYKYNNDNNISYEKELLTEINSINKIKSNNAFKKYNKEKNLLKTKKGENTLNSSSNYLDYEQQLISYSTRYENKKNKSQKKASLKINKYNDLNNKSLSSNCSAHLNKEKNKYYYNKSSKKKAKITKKFKNISKNKINNSKKVNKTIIKIKKNSQKKRNDAKEDELSLFQGKINYNEVSLKNIRETIDDLIKKYEELGYNYIKKGKTKYQFVKGEDIYRVEIMTLGNGLLYYKYY